VSTNKFIFLETLDCTAEYNMAFDSHLLDCLGNSGRVQFWRIYSWKPTAISVGKNQIVENVLELDMLSLEGVGVVKRPTGGRAIYHKNDICISTAGLISGEKSLGANARDIYLNFAGLLKIFISKLKASAELARGSRLDRNHRNGIGKLPCFLSATPYELTSSGKKIAGIALYLSRDRYLIQSSIKIGKYDSDDFRFFKGFKSSSSMFEGLTSLEEEAGRSIKSSEIKSALIDTLESGQRLKLTEMDIDHSGIK
jgi:lipoyl(octanoyl) transferase